MLKHFFTNISPDDKKFIKANIFDALFIVTNVLENKNISI